jgi:hypothetical protein
MAITKIPAAGFTGNNFRNIIINGDMSIAQRGTSSSGITSSGYICVDRFRHGINNQGTWTISQDTTVPSGQGFTKSMKMDCTTADASPSADDYVWFEQKIEGLANLQHLKKGTSNAESVTVSFWVNATKTGTNVLELYDKDNTRHICQTYTINSSNTWEKKTITFAGDTTGTFNFDNGESASLLFWIGAGSNYTSGALDTTWGSVSGRAAHRAGGQVNHADSTSNNFYLTGIQMEAGTTASDFEFLPYDVNLQRCQRYFYKVTDGTETQRTIGNFSYYTGTSMIGAITIGNTMRDNPSLVQTTGTNYFGFERDGGVDAFNSFTITRVGRNCVYAYNSTEMSGTQGRAGLVYTQNINANISLDSEL